MRILTAHFRRASAPALGALGALLWLAQAQAAGPGPGLTSESLSVGFSQAAFLNVNRNDAEAGLKALAETVARRLGYLVASKTQLFEEASTFEAALKNGTVNLAVIDSWKYLGMHIDGVATPVFTSMEQGKVGKEYVLLTRRGSGLNTLADLRGKEIAEFEATNFTLGHVWLETLLLENRLGNHHQFFVSVESVGKPSAAVLPVFFGKKQACVVDSAGLELMKELNPQVGHALQIVAVSERLVDGILCLSNNGWTNEVFKRDVIRALGELHLEPSGQQLLTLFKAGQLIPFKEAHLETVRKLRQRHDQLQHQLQPVAGSPAAETNPSPPSSAPPRLQPKGDQ